MEVEGQRNEPVANYPKSQYKYNYHELYKNTRESNELKGSWKKKFVNQLSAKSKQDRFQKAAATRNNFQNPVETFRQLVEDEWELFRKQEGLSHLTKDEMADFLLSLQEELLNPDEDILRMYEEQQEWEARALLEQIKEYEATYQQDYDTLSSQQKEMEEHEMT